MPFYQFLCEADIEPHIVEKFFKTFSEAAKYEDEFTCPKHGCIARRVPSAPLGFGLYGSPEGFSKPSSTKRFTTKTVSQKDGNRWSVG